MQGVEQAPAALRVDLTNRQAPPNSRYIFERVSLDDENAKPTQYSVHHLPRALREGAFANTDIESLTPYFAQDASDGRVLDGSLWPQPWIEGSAGVLLRFEQPIVYLPDMLDANHRWRQKTRVDVHDPRGRKYLTAAVTRDIELEGYETVSVGEQAYPDCVRIRATTRITHPWIARVNIDEYLWLAPGKGCVRRVQAVRGSVFFRYFKDVVEDKLVRIETIRAPNNAQSPLGVGDPGAWRRVAFFFNPGWPKPRLAGVIADYTASPGRVSDEHE